MWSVVEFIDGFQLVPSLWINKNNSECFWPPFTSQAKTNKSIKEKVLPDKNWPIHKIKRVFCNAESYDTGIKKLKLAEIFSDLDTEDDEVAKKRRKLTVNKIIEENDTTDDETLRPVFNKTKDAECREKLNFGDSQTETNSECSFDTENIILGEYVICDDVAQRVESEYVAESSTPIKTQSQDLFITKIVTPRKKLSHKPYEHHPETDFQQDVMKKLDTLIFEIRKVDERLNQLETAIQTTIGSGTVTIVDELFENSMFPLQNEVAVQNIENQLNDKNFVLRVVASLKMLGGTDSYQTVANIMKTILSNAVAEKYSFLGAKAKKSFKKLSLYKVVLATARARHPEITEAEVGEIVARWLVGAKLRLLREKTKHNKDQQEESSIVTLLDCSESTSSSFNGTTNMPTIIKSEIEC